MSTFSIEAMKASRDQLRIFNAHALSKSIQFYYSLNGDYPESGLRNNVSEFLFNEKLLTNTVRDPAYTSATIPFNYYYYKSIVIALPQIVLKSDFHMASVSDDL